MPRPRTGSLELRTGVFFCRITVRAAGKVSRPWVCLNTGDEATARARMAKANEDAAKGLAAPAPTTTRQTFGEYAEAWRKAREARGIASADSERSLLKNHVQPALGALPLPDVRTRAIRGLLETLLAKKLARQTIVHVLGAVRGVLTQAREDELVEAVPDMPKIPDLHEVEKERAQLTDAELATLWACPKVDLEIKLMTLTARTEGGMRTRDVTAWSWDMIDHPGFGSCVVPRTKTGLPQRLEIPEVLQGPLCRWWVAQGRPTEGPVFPVTKGKRRGEARKARGVSFAGRLRRALLLAGITRHELHHPTAVSLPVGFHSACRGGFVSALAEADVPTREAARLTGHADERTHRKYALKTTKMQRIPAAAVPRIATGIATAPGDDRDFLGAGHEIRTRDPQLGKPNRGEEPQQFQALTTGTRQDAPQRFAVRRDELPRIATAVDGVDGDEVAALVGGIVLLGVVSPMAALELAEAEGELDDVLAEVGRR